MPFPAAACCAAMCTSPASETARFPRSRRPDGGLLPPPGALPGPGPSSESSPDCGGAPFSQRVSDDWETDRASLTMEARCPTSENPDLQKGCCSIRVTPRWHAGTSPKPPGLFAWTTTRARWPSRTRSPGRGRRGTRATRRSNCPVVTGYFLAAGFALSCFGFMLFLSFFCELFPLPMVLLPRVRDWIRARASPSDHSIGRNCRHVQFTGWDFSSAARCYSCSPST